MTLLGRGFHQGRRESHSDLTIRNVGYPDVWLISGGLSVKRMILPQEQELGMRRLEYVKRAKTEHGIQASGDQSCIRLFASSF